MSFHILTEKCFLTCEKVTAIVIEEALPEERASKSKKIKKPEPLYYTITITYIPGNKNNNYDAGENCLEVRISEKKKAISVFGEIVKQVQEQFPNEVYLDKLVNSMLGSSNHEIVEIES